MELMKRESMKLGDIDIDNETDMKDVPALEILLKRRHDEDRRKARHHWTLLRNSIQHTVEAVAESDIKDLVITHGIHHDRKLNHTKTLEHVVFVPPRKEYVTTDGQTFRVFLEDGRKKVTVTPEEPVNRLVYATQTNQYVGWVHNEEMLYLMGEDFEIISQARCPGKILLGSYNQNTGEMVTLGNYFMQSWSFRYGARHLIPRLTKSTNFGDDNMFSMMVLEETASRSQRAFLACGLGVVVYNVYEGRLLLHKKELHRRVITALNYFNPLKYLITAAQDGSIKVWDNSWHVVMVFVGHRRQVNHLSIYPSGPLVVSASLDNTIRVWNLETCDEVDRVTIQEPVVGLGVSMQYDVFFTFYNKTVDLWRIQHLYQMHTAIGHRVTNIKMTTHPNYPVRAVLMCRDSGIRIVSPPTGNVITTMLMEHGKRIIDAEYAIEQEMLFAVLSDGEIIKARTDTNPCTVVARWKCQNPEDVCNYLLVYEYVVDSTAQHDIWALMKKGVATRSIANLAPAKQSRNRTLLLGGRRDGYICLFNWDTGNIDFKVEAHGIKGVLSMIANSKSDQVISAGMDNVIKVWRLYPFAEEALAPLMSFYCAHTPSHMTTIKTRLCVTFQDPSTATFNTVLYNLKDKDRFDHKPDDDHLDLVTGMSSCPRMKLFATCSMDGTVRIWNEANVLVRLLRLNTYPYSIGFCSQKGDLLLGTGDHLFKIPYSKYMPRAHKFRMVSMKFEEMPDEEPIPYDDNLLNMLSKQDVKRLKNSHSSFKFAHFVDILSEEEKQEVVKEKLIKKEAFSELEARENELKRIRDGELKAKSRPYATKETKSEAFLNYMKIFYDKPKFQMPDEDQFSEDAVQRLLKEDESPSPESYHGVKEPTGFFPDRPKTPLEPLQPGYPVTHGGFIPNSVLVKLLWPPPRPAFPAERSGTYVPPSLTSEQLAEINDLNKDARASSATKRAVTFGDNGDISTRVFEFDWDDDESSEGLRTPTSPRSGRSPEVPKVVEGKTSNLMSKMADIMTRTPTPKEEEEELVLTPKADSFKSGTPPGKDRESSAASSNSSAAAPLPTPPKRELKPTQPLRKFVTRPKVKDPSPSPSPEYKSPTPEPPPPTPLPRFIRQFQGTEWFEKYFPNLTAGTMPKPWTSDTLANMILRLIRIADLEHKRAVVEAITLLFTQENLMGATTIQVQKAIYAALNHHTKPLTCAVEEEKAFIISSIRCLQVLAVKDLDFVTEMMVQFLDGDRDVRSMIMDVIASCGLQDPHRHFQKELDSWDIWNLDEGDRKLELRRMCQQWLNRWMTSYKLHIQDTVDRMKKGQNVHGKMTRGQIQKHQNKTGTNAGGDIADDQTTNTTLPDGVEFIPAPHTTSHSMTVTFDKMPESAILESVTHMDAVNYFCEMMVEKEIESMKKGRARRPGLTGQEKQGPPKNTVLVLPKLPHKAALVRLGETHTSTCRRKNAESENIDFRFPPIGGRGHPVVTGEITTFVPSINLPMKTLYMNPFPSYLDRLDARFQEPVLITLKSAQKFFIPSLSYIPTEPQVAPTS